MAMLSGLLLLSGFSGCGNSSCEKDDSKLNKKNCKNSKTENSKKEEKHKKKSPNKKKHHTKAKSTSKSTVKSTSYEDLDDDSDNSDLAFLDGLSTEQALKTQEEITRLIAMIEEENKALGKEQEASDQPYQTVLFESGVTELGSDQYSLVMANSQKVAEAVKNGKTIVVRGHSDALESNYSEAQAFNLSKKRCEFIKDEFVKAGIPESHVEVASIGNLEPIVYNFDKDQPELSMPNRRVEILTI
jgi:outer membrane protein OmpA-like peptidoglycan-associated protein